MSKLIDVKGRTFGTLEAYRKRLDPDASPYYIFNLNLINDGWFIFEIEFKMNEIESSVASEYLELCGKFLAWAEENCEDYYILRQWHIMFLSEMDAMAFKLRWL